jgi:hypothetical protein
MWLLLALFVTANGTGVSRTVEVHSQYDSCEARMHELNGLSTRVTFTCAMRG